jgi:hypothetical protein
MDSAGSPYIPVATFCEHCDEPTGSISIIFFLQNELKSLLDEGVGWSSVVLTLFVVSWLLHIVQF